MIQTKIIRTFPGSFLKALGKKDSFPLEKEEGLELSVEDLLAHGDSFLTNRTHTGATHRCLSPWKPSWA